MTGHISQSQLSEWLDGQLPAQEAGRVEEHLAACEACRAIGHEMSIVNMLFQKAESLTPPPALWARIASELQCSRSGHLSRSRSFSWLDLIRGGTWQPARLQIRALIPVVALILVLIVGGSLTLQQYRSAVRNRTAAMVEIDRVHSTLVAINLPTYNPFQFAAGSDPNRNPFSLSQTGISPNPFRPLLSSSQEEGLR